MEIYILDSLLRPIDLIDELESFIWTERYSVKGDFELVTQATPANRRRFVEDTMLAIADSKRIMRVKTVEDTVDQDKGSTLTIKGFELVSILEERTLAILEDGGTHDGMLLAVNYYNGFRPIEIPGFMVWQVCDPTSGWQFSAGDTIPFLQPSNAYPVVGSLYPPGNLPEPSPGGILWEQKIASLYSAITDVCKAYDIGFRLYKDPSASKLFFEAYLGNDRTSAQTTFTPVVFSSDMTNLQDTTEYSDGTDHFNVVIAAYEYKNDAPGGYPTTLTIHQVATGAELAFSSGGFDQKTKYLSVTSLPDGMDLVDAPAYLLDLAQQELTRSRPVSIFDGEIDQHGEFVYERDYFLGDLVEIRGNNGGAAYMRVEEQIIKFDANGKSSYPSLATKTSISPGTWKSWKYDVNWNAMGSGEYWNNQ